MRAPRPLLTRSLAEARAAIASVDPALVIVMPLRDGAATLGPALTSIFVQEGLLGRPLVLLVDDASGDDWRSRVVALRPALPVVGVTRRCGRAATARNLGLRLARESAPNLRLIVLLDAVDELYDHATLRRIERLFTSTASTRGPGRRHPEALIGGNLQRRAGVILSRPNLTDGSLLTSGGLLTRLEGMAAGQPAAELPSCNVVLGSGSRLLYPDVASGEDHWLTVRLLMGAPGTVRVVGDLVHSVYSLAGALTAENQRGASFVASRRELLAWACRRLVGRRYWT